jgi:titin
LSWKPPKDDGGSPITNYIVECREDGAFKWKRASKTTLEETKFTVKGLMEETKYEFRVAAENRAGVSAYSENTMAVKPLEKIGV